MLRDASTVPKEYVNVGPMEEKHRQKTCLTFHQAQTTLSRLLPAGMLISLMTEEKGSVLAGNWERTRGWKIKGLSKQSCCHPCPKYVTTECFKTEMWAKEQPQSGMWLENQDWSKQQELKSPKLQHTVGLTRISLGKSNTTRGQKMGCDTSPHKRSVFGGISCTGIGEKPGSTPQCLGWPPSCTAGKQNWWTTKQLRKSQWGSPCLCLQAALAKKEHRCSSPLSLSLKPEILRSSSTSCYIQKVNHTHVQALSYCQNSFMFRGFWAGAKSGAKSVHLLQRSKFYTSPFQIQPETQGKNRKVHLLPIPKGQG